jgi:hypothetical protein
LTGQRVAIAGRAEPSPIESSGGGARCRHSSAASCLARPPAPAASARLGAKFVAAGVLGAAIELLERGAIDMYGVIAGDHAEMTARARDALPRAAATQQTNGEIR